MPPQFLFPIDTIDLTKVVYDQEAIRAVNPQRGDMEHLNWICHADPDNGRIIGVKDVGEKEFWIPGHLPGRPLLPGVIMVEAGAQVASFYTKMFLKWPGFVGFGGVDGVKFRAQVVPGQRLYILGQKLWERHKRVHCQVQGIVNGAMVFEAAITGVGF